MEARAFWRCCAAESCFNDDALDEDPAEEDDTLREECDGICVCTRRKWKRRRRLEQKKQPSEMIKLSIKNKKIVVIRNAEYYIINQSIKLNN